MIDRILAQLQRAHDNASTILHESTCERYENCSCENAKDIRGFEKALKDVVFVVSEARLEAFKRLLVGLTVTHKLAAASDSGHPASRHAPAVENCPCQLAQDVRAFQDHLVRLEKNRTQAAYLQGDRPEADETEPEDGTSEDFDQLRPAEQATAKSTWRDEFDQAHGRAPLVPSYVGRCTVEGLSPSEHTFVQDEDGTTRPGKVDDDGNVVPIETIDKPGSTPRPAERRPYVQPEELTARGPDLDDLTERTAEDFAGMVSATTEPERSDGIVAFDQPTTPEERLGEQPRTREEKEGIWTKMSPAEAERVRSKARFGRFGVSVDIHRDAAGKVLVAVHVGSDTGTILFDKRHYDVLRAAFPPLVTSRAPDFMPEPSRSEELPAGKDWVSVTELDEQLRDKEDDFGPDDFDDQRFMPAIRDAVFRMAMGEVFTFAAKQAKEMGQALRKLGETLTTEEKDKPPANTVPWTDDDTRELSFGKLLACAERIGKQNVCSCAAVPGGICSHCMLREAVDACAQATAR